MSLKSLSDMLLSNHTSALACLDFMIDLFTPEIAENIDLNMLYVSPYYV